MYGEIKIVELYYPLFNRTIEVCLNSNKNKIEESLKFLKSYALKYKQKEDEEFKESYKKT